MNKCGKLKLSAVPFGSTHSLRTRFRMWPPQLKTSSSRKPTRLQFHTIHNRRKHYWLYLSFRLCDSFKFLVRNIFKNLMVYFKLITQFNKRELVILEMAELSALLK